MLLYWIWFAVLKELSAMQKRLLLEHFSDPEEIYCAQEPALSCVEGLEPQTVQLLKDKDLTEAQRILETCEQKQIKILTYGDGAYPRRLRYIHEPPVILYYKGNLPDFEQTATVAVVGTRKATAYGLGTARKMSRQIAACGALVVSGAAFGIDAMAMYGAMEAECPVVGVLGCGVDVIYPKSNRNLFAQVLEKGCLLSEYPPGTPPLKWNFPRRNRILSGMANGVLVIEAPKISGALSTARWALQQGRDVFVVPGNIDVAACEGSNALLNEEARAACSGWDVVKEYVPLYPGRLEKKAVPIHAGDLPEEIPVTQVAQTAALPIKEKPNIRKNDRKSIDNAEIYPYSGIKDTLPVLNGEEQAIVACLSSQPRPVDEVIAETGMPAAKVLGMLTTLALKGVVVNHPGKSVSLKQEKPKH